LRGTILRVVLIVAFVVLLVIGLKADEFSDILFKGSIL